MSPEIVRRVLIYRLGSLGDTLVALPCFHLVARTFPEAERALLTNFPVNSKAPPAAEILGGSGLVHRYIQYPIGIRSFGEALELKRAVQAYRPDLLVYLAAPRGFVKLFRDHSFFRLCGVRHVVGVPYGELSTHRRVPGTSKFEGEYERLARALRELGDARVDSAASWDLRLSSEEVETARRHVAPLAGRRIVALSVGSKVDAKDWTDANWRPLLQRIRQRWPDAALVYLGAQEDAERSESLAQFAGLSFVNLCGQLTPRVSAAVLSLCNVFLGHDSGPMHLAASQGVPCLAIFASRSKLGVWFPYGSQHEVLYHEVACMNCALDTCVVERKRCILSISVEEAEAALVRLFAVADRKLQRLWWPGEMSRGEGSTVPRTASPFDLPLIQKCS